MKRTTLKIALVFATVTILSSCASNKDGCYDFSHEDILEHINTPNELEECLEVHSLD